MAILVVVLIPTPPPSLPPPPSRIRRREYVSSNILFKEYNHQYNGSCILIISPIVLIVKLDIAVLILLLVRVSGYCHNNCYYNLRFPQHLHHLCTRVPCKYSEES